MSREPELMLAVREEVVPLLRTYPSSRVWVAGCATGEEVYGFAILLEDEGVLDRCSIYATDFNEDMLAVARMGSYPLERIRRYEDAYRTSGGRGSLADHYSVAGRSARFDRRLARSVTWAKHNLATDGSFNDFHLIVCANVLIYFRESLQERAHRLIYDSLIRGGFLALDQAETDMGRGYNLGAVDFVFAPIVPAIMRAKVSVFVELYRAQQELRRYRTQLETLVEERTIALTAINRELEAFSYSVSNDLRAPLASFDGLSKTLVEEHGKELDKRTIANLKKMREASERMASVFDGLQMLFRLSSGEIRREEVDVTALAGQVVDELRAADPDRKVSVDVAPEVTVSGDKRLVRILLSNLINNAWKFTATKEGPGISVGREVVDGES